MPRRLGEAAPCFKVARGSLIVDADLQAALDSGHVAVAALDVFDREPITEHPHAVMVLTTDSAVPQALIDEILGSWDIFVDGRTVSLA